MIQFYQSSEGIYDDQDISLIRKLTDEVYIDTFHWSVCRDCETMCMDGDFQHFHFLTTMTVIDVISNMLSLIFLCIFQILESFKVYVQVQSGQLLSCATCQSLNIERDSVRMTQYVELRRYILVNILSASQSCCFDIDVRESLRYHYQHQV